MTGLKIVSMNLIDVTEHVDNYSNPATLNECWTYAVRTYKGELKSNAELITEGEGILKWIDAQELSKGAFGELCAHLTQVYYKYIGKHI